MDTLFSSLIVIIINKIIKSIGLCLSVFDWIYFNQTSNNCLDRINVREIQPNTSRWFLWMFERVVGNSSGKRTHDRKLSIISRRRPTSSVLNFKINFVKHGKSYGKRKINLILIEKKIPQKNMNKINLHHLVHYFWCNEWFSGKSANVCSDSSTYYQRYRLYQVSKSPHRLVTIPYNKNFWLKSQKQNVININFMLTSIFGWHHCVGSNRWYPLNFV